MTMPFEQKPHDVPPLPDPNEPRYPDGIGQGLEGFGPQTSGGHDNFTPSDEFRIPTHAPEYRQPQPPYSPETLTTDDDTKKKKRNVLIAAGAAAATLAAGAALWLGGSSDKDSDNTFLPPATPGTSAPAAPGASTEQTPTTVETSTRSVEITDENVELHAGNKVYVGIGGKEGFIAKEGIFERNDPKNPKTLTQGKAQERIEKFFNNVALCTTLTTSPEGEEYIAEATAKLLFVANQTGELSQFVNQLQSNGQVITEVKEASTTDKPEPLYVHGKAIVTVLDKDGTTEQYRITVSTVNDSGIIHNLPHVSTVVKIPSN